MSSSLSVGWTETDAAKTALKVMLRAWAGQLKATDTGGHKTRRAEDIAMVVGFLERERKPLVQWGQHAS